MQRSYEYDLLVIGSGPAGQKAAIQAAKLGRKVAVVEREPAPALGGVSANTGTIPSKTARAAILDLTGFSQRSVYGDAYRVASTITIDDLLWRTQHVIERECAVVRYQLRRNGVDVIEGAASFLDPHTLKVGGPHPLSLGADRIVIAVGTRPARPSGVDFDDRIVIDSDGLGGLERVPATLTVVGAGVIGIEYAAMAAALGVTVTVVDKRTELLDFVDDELVDALRYHLRGLGVTLRLGDEVTTVERRPDGSAVTNLASGKRIPSDVVLYAAGRQGATADLCLDAAGLEADERGRILVDAHFRTAQPHIFAVGDVIGFPALAATSMEQGRLAACAAFGVQASELSPALPYGIYTIPEISFVGRTERELTERGVPYVVGIARYRELTRGEIAGDNTGLLKLLVHADTRRLEGVHVFGTGATELVHIGQTAMAGGLTVDYLVDAVFNYPTFSDAYKIAALDAANKLHDIQADRPFPRAVGE
jgi:NAD(P) transhydrogenase